MGFCSLSLSLSRRPIIFVISALLIFGAFLNFLHKDNKAEANGSSWYDSSWQYRKKITIDHTKVSADQTNFPVYVDLSSDPDLAAHAQADGEDILFTGSDGVTKLDHDLSRENVSEQFTPDGAWCWFQDPKAVHYEGTQNQTYVGWVNSSGDVQVGSYNHSTDTMSIVTLHPALQFDDHAAPSILIRPDGRLMVFYSAHGGASMFYRLSTNPEDISSWGVEQTVGTNVPAGPGYAYPNPVQLSSEGNKIYLFWRGGNWKPTFSTSTDGTSWSTAKTLFSVPTPRPYTKVVSDGTGKIHFTFTDGHPDNVANNNIYYAYYYNGSFYKADGTLIKTMADVVAGNPLLPAEVDKVYDAVAGGSGGWNWDIALDGSGNPVIVYANFPTTSDHRYRYVRWTDSAWSDHEITPAGGYIDGASQLYYSGGITLDHENPSIVYLSRQISGVHEIEKWTTSDNGATWSSESITSGSSKKNVRPIVPRGHTSDDLGVIWMNGDYPSYTTYDTALKIHQPVSLLLPPISEAHVKIPTLLSSTDTEIYMYYGNSAATDQSNPTGVWDSNFKMVQHLNDGTENETYDSTISDNDGMKWAANQPNEISGKINKAQNFDGSDDYISTGTGVNMASWNALTFEAWVKYEEGIKTDEYAVISNWTNSITKAAVLARVEPAGDFLEAYVETQPDATVGGGFADLHFDSNWHHLIVTYDTTNGLKAYLDGVASSTSYTSSASLDTDTSAVLNIGYASFSSPDGFKGRIDEVRISNILRSTTWISTEYNNQSLPSTFYGVGSEDVLTPPSVTVQVADSITASSAVLHGTITATGGQNATIRGFKYYQSADCTGTENDRSENGSYGAEAYSLNLASLTSNTAYSYKSYATSPAGTGTSPTCEAFTTLSNAPTVTVQAASALAQTTATLNGTITDVDGVNATERGFNVYNGAVCAGGSIQNPKDTGGSYGVGAFSKGAIGLTSNTAYSYTAYAINTGGTGTSTCQSLTTLPNAPTITIQAATALTQTTATLNGTITDVDGVNATERGFNVYSGAICASGSIQNPKDTGGSYGAGAFSKGTNVALTLNTIYSYTAYAINTGGTGTSGCQSFVTLANIPSTPTKNYNTTTSLTVIINPNSNPAGTLFAIQNMTSGQYVKADGTLQAGEVWQTRAAWGGNFGIANTGLNANTQYNYKIKAKNDAGIETVLSSGIAKYTGASNPGATTATALSSSSIKVDWTSGGAQSKFNVYRNGQSGVGTLVHSANDLTYTDDGLAASTPYTYYVYSINEDSVKNLNFTSATVSTQTAAVPPSGNGSTPTPTPTPTPSFDTTATPSSEESATPQNANETEVDYISPTADFSIQQDPSVFVTGKSISFDATGSTDNTKISSYEWDFGDGETSELPKVNHQFKKPGRYTVTLTVIDNAGNISVTTQTIDIKPSIPIITNIKAKGTALWVEGNSDPDTIVYLTIYSDPYNIQALADKNGYWTYNLENASDILGQGSHTILALASVKLSDNSEIRGQESKTYDFYLTVDNGKLKVEMKKTRAWMFVSLGLVFVIVVGTVLMRKRKRI